MSDRVILVTKDQVQSHAVDEVINERASQDLKWGEQRHPYEWWLAILGEEFGELCQAILETHFTGNPEHKTKGGVKNIKAEAIQVCAVALALIECINRNEAEAGDR